MLGRTHRFWASDSNDALARQAIQKGWLRFFPPEVMGAHVGPSAGGTPPDGGTASGSARRRR